MNNKPDISILIPLYRGKDSIHECLESILAQDQASIELLLLDNGCPEDTGEWAGYWLSSQDVGFSWKLLEEKTNTGFAAAMNRLYSESSGTFILCLNQDVVMDRDHVSVLLDALGGNENWAGVTGTLIRPGTTGEGRLIDTTGHIIFRDRIVRNRGTGLPFTSLEDLPWNDGEVFGVSAACAMYRREAIESVREEEGLFDPDFFSYFEDIDLDYRLHRGGWKLGWVRNATGSHALGGSKGRKELGVRIRAYGNRRRLILKHESISSLLPDLGPIMLQEIYGFVRALLIDPIASVAGPIHFLSSLGRVIKRRKRLDTNLGRDRTWIRQWLQSQRERFERN